MNGRPVRTTHSSPRTPSGPRSGRAIQAASVAVERRAGSAGSGGGSPAAFSWATRQTEPSSAIARRSRPAADPQPSTLARVGQAGDGALGAQQVAGVLGDRVEDVAQVGAAGELEGDGVQGLALALAAVEVRDGDAQLGGAGDLARDVERGPPR